MQNIIYFTWQVSGSVNGVCVLQSLLNSFSEWYFIEILGILNLPLFCSFWCVASYFKGPVKHDLRALRKPSCPSFIVFTIVSFLLVFFFSSDRRLANKHVLKDMFIFKKKPNSDQTSRQPHPSSSMISYLRAWLIILMAPYPYWVFWKESSFLSYSPGWHAGEHCTCVIFFSHVLLSLLHHPE